MHAEHADNRELNELSGRVIGCVFTVLNTLGAGFLEKANGNGLVYEVRAAGLSAVQQCGAKVHYRDTFVGKYFVDLLINDVLLVELKTPCLLLNFGKPRLEIKRLTNGLWSSACSACIAFLHLR